MKISKQCVMLMGWLLSIIAVHGVAYAATSVAGLSAHDNPLVAEGPTQPIAYSHQKHLALGLPCTQCHTQPEPKRMMTFPPTSTCMGCHQVLAKDSPEIKKLAEYHAARKEVPWVRVYKVMEGVNWTHEPHIKAGLDCAACHGDVASLPVMKMLKSPQTMGGCFDCHSAAKAPTACETCHTAWSAEMQIDLKKMANAVGHMSGTGAVTSKTSSQSGNKSSSGTSNATKRQ